MFLHSKKYRKGKKIKLYLFHGHFPMDIMLTCQKCIFRFKVSIWIHSRYSTKFTLKMEHSSSNSHFIFANTVIFTIVLRTNSCDIQSHCRLVSMLIGSGKCVCGNISRLYKENCCNNHQNGLK